MRAPEDPRISRLQAGEYVNLARVGGRWQIHRVSTVNPMPAKKRTPLGAVVGVRVTLAEHRRINEEARRHGITTSDLIRAQLLRANLISPPQSSLISPPQSREAAA